MAGIANFKGKKAAPFVKGGGQSKALRKKALKALAKAKAKGEPDADDLSNVDLSGLANFKGKKAAPFVKGGKRRKAVLVRNRAKARKGASLATGVSGSEIDLDWSAWNAAHKGQSRPGVQRTRTATKSGASFSEIKNFKKSAGLKGGGLGPKAQTVLEARAAAPGDHFRAKAILAAQSGNKALAAKYTAQMVAKRARELKARGSKAKPFNPAPRRGVSLSNTDLSVLTAAERDALPASAFVFPGRRAYPIHDKAHARNALARSAGKPEHAAVVAAVRARYPGLGA